MTRTFIIASPLCAFAATLVAAPLAAENQVTVKGQPVFQESVSHADLDLTKWAHRNTLRGRVYRASERVCIAAEGEFDANLGIMGKPSCTETTYDAARPQIRAAIDRARSRQPVMATNLVVSAQRAR